MNDRKYESLVWGLQAEANDKPAAFRRKVIFISLSAYLFIAALLIGLCLLTWWMSTSHHTLYKRGWFMYVAIGAALTLIPLVFVFLRVFLMRIPSPKGHELSAKEAPKLFKLLSDLRKKLDGPPIHQVLLTDEFNAAICQTPRFGLFGGHKNTLILGLPFLYAMSAREMLAVIAHEYGHLSGSHGKMGAWIYRQRRTFGALHQHTQSRRDDDHINYLLAECLDYFAPYYNAHTFVLSRQNEYEADATAARVVGAQHLASALIRSSLLGRWLANDFWPKLYEQAKERSQPAFLPFMAMNKIVPGASVDWATMAHLKEAWAVESDVHDTHPCLRERLEALDVAQHLPPPIITNAAVAMLGEHAVTLTHDFDKRWWQDEKKRWLDFNRNYTTAQVRINVFAQKELVELTPSELQEYALLLIDYRSIVDAKLILERLIRRPGDRYPKPIYYYGRVLLDENNAQGLQYLEEACRLSPALTDDCVSAGYQWLCRNRGETAVDNWVDRLLETTDG